MLQRKSELLNYIDALRAQYAIAASSAPTELSELSEKFGKASLEIQQKVQAGELLVPVVGGFSAGKSSALNAFMGVDILPVAVTAETAIPAELRYSTDEHIMAITMEGECERHNISALPKLSLNAKKYQVVEVYLNCQALKNIEPFVLVDMPGFDSPLEQHNQATLRYLNRGVFYLYLVSSKDGALRRQDMRRLHEAQGMGRSFSVIMTKKDLCETTELEGIREHIFNQVLMDLGSGFSVNSMSAEDSTPLCDAISELDANTLFDNAFCSSVSELFFSASANINSAISSLKKSEDERKAEIAKLQATLQAIRNERDSSIDKIKSRSLDGMERDIANKIETELTKSIDELASLAGAGNDQLSRAVSEIVRSSMATELQKAVYKISGQIVSNYESAINVSIAQELNVSAGWLENIMSTLRSDVVGVLLSVVGSKNTKGKAYGSVAGLLSGAALLIPHPVAKVVFSILPRIVAQLFDGVNKAREKAAYADAIRNQVVPNVLQQIRPEVSGALLRATESMVQALEQKFEQTISDSTSIFEKAKADMDAQSGDTNERLASLEAVRKKINELTETSRI